MGKADRPYRLGNRNVAPIIQRYPGRIRMQGSRIAMVKGWLLSTGSVRKEGDLSPI